MAEYTGPSTDNEAEMLPQASTGRIVPDTFATDRQDDGDKFGNRHAKVIDNSLDRYRGTNPEGFKRDGV